LSDSTFFTPFPHPVPASQIPDCLNDPFSSEPHPLCFLAAKQLQTYLSNQTEWEHNFGLIEGQEGTIIGKMFGVLVVRTEQNEIGYLAGYSGKLAGGYHQSAFVPPVFDGLTEGSFLNLGMTELSRIGQKIKELEETNSIENQSEIALLKKTRKENSAAIQHEIFDNYHFINAHGDKKCMRDIFQQWNQTKPPSGAGECAAPRLLQFSFQNKMKPLALAEFWWGKSPKSDFWKHGHFYSACKEKCEPILHFMLSETVLGQL